MTNGLSREQLVDKYGIGNPPQLDNPIVQTILRTDQIATGTGWGHDAVFDPAWNPALYAKATAAHHNLRAAMAADEVTYDGAPYDHDDPNDVATLVNFVGDNRLFVCRSAADRFATLLRYSTCELDPTRRCAISIADNCNDEQGMRWMLMARMGVFLLLFECCTACRAKAIETAETNYQFGPWRPMSARRKHLCRHGHTRQAVGRGGGRHCDVGCGCG